MKLTKSNELKVGFMTIILLAGIVVSFLIFGNIEFGGEKGHEYILNFKFLDGLKQGMAVRFSGGINCGIVKDVYSNDEFASVVIFVRESIPINSNTVFSIQTTSLIGEKYVNLKQIAEGGNPIPPGTTISRANIIDPMNFDETLLKVNNIVSDISGLSSSISQFIDDQGTEDIGHAVNNISVLIKTINDLLSGNKDILDNSVKELNLIMKNINNITEKADAIIGTTLKLTDSLSGDELSLLVNNVNTMVISVTSIVNQIDLVVSDTRHGLSAFMNKLDGFVESTESVITNIGPEIGMVLTNVDTTFQSVADEIKELVVTAGSAIGVLSEEVSISLNSLNSTAVGLSNKFDSTLGEFEFQVSGLVTDLRRTIRTVDNSVGGITRELIALTETSSVKIDETLTLIRDLTRGIKNSVDVFDPETLEEILASIKALTSNLEEIAKSTGGRVDEIFDKIEAITNDIVEIVAQAKEELAPTLEAIRTLSNTLENLSIVGEEKIIQFFNTLEEISNNLAFLTEGGENRIKEMFENIDSLIKNLNDISKNISPGLEEFFATNGQLASIVEQVNEIIITMQDVFVNLQTDVSVSLENFDEAAQDVSAFFEAASQIEPIITSINDLINELSAASEEEGFEMGDILDILVQLREIVETLRYITDQIVPLLNQGGG